ncbi:sterol desaturase family protein [bacterium]|nr:MAG: sterol desaturase family protein [bacterium]
MDFNNESFLFVSGYQKLFVLSVFMALIIAEKYRTHRQNDKNIVQRSYGLNIKIFLFNDIITNVLSVSSLLLIADRYSHFGPLNHIESIPTKVFLSFVLFDLMLYWLHVARHKCPFLWNFHKVHHSDLDMNTTTALRLHIMEVLLTTAAKAIFIIIAGIPSLLIAFNEIVITAIVMMNHSNVLLCKEKLIAFVFIVPSRHVVHHSSYWKEHESNFGFALSFWDRIFGTYQSSEPKILGLEKIQEPCFWETLFLNFKKTKK